MFEQTQSATLAASKLTASFLCLRLEAEPGVWVVLGACPGVFGVLGPFLQSCPLTGGGVFDTVGLDDVWEGSSSG